MNIQGGGRGEERKKGGAVMKGFLKPAEKQQNMLLELHCGT